MKYKFSILALALCVTGCTFDGAPPLAKMTFAHLKPVSLLISSYEPVAFKRVEGGALPVGFVIDPADSVFDFLNRRFVAEGSAEGRLRATVRNVVVEHDVEDSQNKLGAMIGVDHRDHYRIRVNMDLEAYNTFHYEYKIVSLSAQRNLYISEHVSVVDRERAQRDSIEALVDDLDKHINQILHAEFKIVRE